MADGRIVGCWGGWSGGRSVGGRSNGPIGDPLGTHFRTDAFFVAITVEVLPAIVKENEDKKEGEKLAMGDITKKVSAMWAAVPEDIACTSTRSRVFTICPLAP